MGALVAMRYRTKMFAKLADHTYVRCGGGSVAWSCWGGKTGGTALRQAEGSTTRANAIAGPKERAGITCYLVNGVCHQAANRILLPAEITVRGALGYELSEALFGPYGRPRGPLGFCSAPFDQHPDITGDLAACTEEPQPKTLRAKARAVPKSAQASRRERAYLKQVRGMYRRVAPRLQKSMRKAAAIDIADTEREVEAFQLELFRHKVEYNLSGRAGKTTKRRLEHIRRSTERSRLKIEDWFLRGGMSVGEFIDAFNNETIVFQDAASATVTAAQYRQLFDANKGDVYVLADPRIAARALRQVRTRNA